MSKEKKELVPYEQSNLMKSNALIGVKYRASPLSHKVTYLAMLKIQDGEFIDKPDGIHVSLKASDIIRAIGSHSGSIYEALVVAADEITATNYGVVDPVSQSFEFVAPIYKAKYKEGIFSVIFSPPMRQYLVNIQKNFTNLPYQIVMKFKKKYTFPLYQLLRSKCYYPSTYYGKRDNVFLWKISLSELQLDLGVVNSNDGDVRKILRGAKGLEEEYDRAVEASSEKVYKEWSPFRKNVLDPSVKEINAISDIRVDYDTLRSGKGGKVHAIEFIVYLNPKDYDKEDNIQRVSLAEDGHIEPVMSDMDKMLVMIDTGRMFPEITSGDIAKIIERTSYNKELIQIVRESFELMTDYDLPIEDILSITEVAEYDSSKVQSAKAVLDKTKSVNNITGWMIAAIKDDYKEPIAKKSEKSLDFKEIEKIMIMGDIPKE